LPIISPATTPLKLVVTVVVVAIFYFYFNLFK
jgi:hypothetical protein